MNSDEGAASYSYTGLSNVSIPGGILLRIHGKGPRLPVHQKRRQPGLGGAREGFDGAPGQPTWKGSLRQPKWNCRGPNMSGFGYTT